MRFGEAARRLLQDYDVHTVFGIPGVHTIELYRGIDASGIHSVVPRHEQGAGFMADGYSRVTGKPGVCFLVTGPGVLNAMTPIAQAWHDSIPMFVLASTTATTDLGKGRGPLHDLPDQSAIVRSLTSLSETVTDPDRFAEVVADAWASWASGRPRPVHVAVPIDVLASEVGTIRPVARDVRRHRPDAGAITGAVELLADASAPAIIAGGGAVRAAEPIRRLAETLGAPVVTTGNARGLLPADHPLSVGTLLPFPETQRLLRDADVVVAIGTEFSETDVLYTGSPITLDGAIIRIDIDRTQLDVPQPAKVGLVGDSAEVATSLVEGLVARGHSGRSSGAERAARARTTVPWTAQSQSHQQWLDAVAEVLPQDTIVAVDSTQLAYTAHHYLPWSRPGSWLAPYGLGTLGPALPMAIGARVAAPERPVVAIAGDGGVLFTLPELATSVDVGGQLTLVVWDNAGYGEIRDSFDRATAPRSGTETTAHDLVKIAEGFGAHAVRVGDPAGLGHELEASLHRDGTTVIVSTEPGSPAASKGIGA